MSSGGSRTTVTKNEPWSGAKPYLREVMAEAQKLYHAGELAPSAYPFDSYVQPSEQTQTAWNAIENRVLEGSDLRHAAGSRVNSFLTPQGPGPGTRTFQAMSSGAFQDPTRRHYGRMAAGQDLHGNPHLDRTFDTMAQRISERVNREAGLRGRTGSTTHADQLQRGLSDLATDVYARNYETERANQLAALQTLSNQYTADFNRRHTGAQSLFDAYSRQRSMDENAVRLGTDLAASDYADLEKLLQVGALRDQENRLQLSHQMADFDRKHDSKAAAIDRYNAIIGGYASVGGTTSRRDPGQSTDPLALGLRIAGSFAGPFTF